MISHPQLRTQMLAALTTILCVSAQISRAQNLTEYSNDPGARRTLLTRRVGSGPAPEPTEPPYSDQDNTDKVAWEWLKGLSPQELRARLKTTNSRIVDVETIDGGATFDAVTVLNVGSYAKKSAWFQGLTLPQAYAMAIAAGMRVTVVAPYLGKDGAVLVAGEMIDNTGSDQTDWGYAVGTADYVTGKIAHFDRTIQLKPMIGPDRIASSNYVAIGISRSVGAVAMIRATEKAINQKSRSGYRIVEIVPDADNTLTALLQLRRGANRDELSDAFSVHKEPINGSPTFSINLAPSGRHAPVADKYWTFTDPDIVTIEAHAGSLRLICAARVGSRDIMDAAAIIATPVRDK